MLVRVVKKFKEVGFKNCLRIFKNRLRSFFVYKRFKKKATQKDAFKDFLKKLEIKDFSKYFAQLADKDFGFIRKYLSDFNIDNEEIIVQAKELLKDNHQILGFGRFKKSSWHEDVTASNGVFDSTTFYKDIKITTYTSANKDIKVPWHFSRFHHTTILGKAYKILGEPQYAKKAFQEIDDWITKNPFMIGINWLCPMEVAIRSMNWLYFFYFFKDSKNVPAEFWQKFIPALYNHFIYLKNNWEIYDTKTNNHYLTDLLGYFYLCFFFGLNKEMHWGFKEFLREIDKQVFDEGTCYEGSTAYHVLVTEIFYHFLLLAQELDLKIDAKYKNKFHKMCEFSSNIKTSDIKIGDDDSGQIIFGINDNIINKCKPSGNSSEIFYEQFGLSIFGTEKIHLTLRHNSYKKLQPSGHFHNDTASITLAIYNVPLIIDPGSYIYTASAPERNYFRSAKLHNSFFVEEAEPIEFTDDIFSLNLIESNGSDKNFEANNFYYKKMGLSAKRIVTIKDKILIHDQWTNLEDCQKQFVSCWNFTFAPGIVLERKQNAWNIKSEKKVLATLTSDLIFEQIPGFCSLKYGQKQKCSRLFAKKHINLEKQKDFYIVIDV